MEGCIGSRVQNIRRRESFFPLIRFVPGSCFGCLLLTSPPAATVLVDEERHRWCTKCNGIINHITATYSVTLGAHFDALRAPQHPARAAAETTAEGRGGLLLVRKKSDSYRTTYFARVVAIRCENCTRELG